MALARTWWRTIGRIPAVDIFALMLVLGAAMSRRHPVAPMPSRLCRALASLAAALVMLLGLSGVSPELHAWLHQQTAERPAHTCAHHGARSATDIAQVASVEDVEVHACAVTMFSQGVVQHAVTISARPCEGVLRAVDFRAFERLALAQPRYLHLPPQAPPFA